MLMKWSRPGAGGASAGGDDSGVSAVASGTPSESRTRNLLMPCDQPDVQEMMRSHHLAAGGFTPRTLAKKQSELKQAGADRKLLISEPVT